MAKRPVGPCLRLKHNSAVHAKGHDAASITVFRETSKLRCGRSRRHPPHPLVAKQGAVQFDDGDFGCHDGFPGGGKAGYEPIRVGFGEVELEERGSVPIVHVS